MSVFDNPLVAAIRETWPGAGTTIKRGTALTDANEYERAAMQAAGHRAGEYIESIGATDMAQWSGEQWDMFIEVVCGAYVEGLMEMESKAREAASKVRMTF